MKNRRLLITLLGAAALLLVTVLYLPGLHGSWLVDDTPNIEIFLSFTPENADYKSLIFSNNSGPLGRPVSMASFALNHATGLFSTYALKASNLFIHLCNALVLFFLLHGIFSARPASTRHSPLALAGMLALWWAILPLSSSSVLYIVQRMTLLAAFFSLLCLLAYVTGRREMHKSHPRRGQLLVAASLLLLLPLATLAKESALAVVPWLILLELFLFQPGLQRHMPKIVLGLVLATIAGACLLVLVFRLDQAFLWRDFSLAERLLTEARALCSYASQTFLPDSASMGVFHDDYPVSTGFFSPWTTACAVIALASLALVSVVTAGSSWWIVSLGILFFFAGHLIESSIIPLELYFEHRNYLPSAGLLLVVSHLALRLPVSQKLLATLLALYLSLLAVSTHQRSQTWGNQSTLLAISARNHPQSVRAWTDHAENLVSQGKGLEALQTANIAADANPEVASIFYLQMVSIYCRSNQAPPPALVQATAARLGKLPADLPSTFISISTGLDFILTQYRENQCGAADFSPLASGILQFDQGLRRHFGAQRGHPWALRMIMAEWLLQLDRTTDAISLLQDSWDSGDRTQQPMVGLILAKALKQTGNETKLRQVLDQLERVADNPPPDFQAEMTALKSGPQE